MPIYCILMLSFLTSCAFFEEPEVIKDEEKLVEDFLHYELED